MRSLVGLAGAAAAHSLALLRSWLASCSLSSAALHSFTYVTSIPASSHGPQYKILPRVLCGLSPLLLCQPTAAVVSTVTAEEQSYSSFSTLLTATNLEKEYSVEGSKAEGKVEVEAAPGRLALTDA